jgi:hypothetical protein
MNDLSKLKTTNNINFDNSKEIRELRAIQELLKQKTDSEYIEGGYRIIRKGNVTTRININ